MTYYAENGEFLFEFDFSQTVVFRLHLQPTLRKIVSGMQMFTDLVTNHTATGT